MELPAKEILAAAVTIGVAAIGYLQWKRGKRSGRFIDDREIAYKEVWQSLENIHLLIRSPSFDPSAFDEMATQANTLLIRHGLHIADEDKASAANYINALRNLGNLLSAAQLTQQTRREIATTGQQVALPSGLIDAYTAQQDARKAVMEKFRRAIGSGQV